MELIWYSPVECEATEIARYSSQILPYVMDYASVHSVEDGSPEGTVEPSWWREIRRAATDVQSGSIGRGQAPIPVYHIGNNPLHCSIHELSMLEPGIIVLHDISLIDLAKYVGHRREEPSLWLAMMQRQYGVPGRDIGRHSGASEERYQRMLEEFPLFQSFVEKSLGVVVHSDFARDAVLRQLPQGPELLKVNLPYPVPDAPPSRDYESEQLRFVFCGHVGPNRRLAEFFRAWGQLDSPGRIRLDLFGKIENTSQLLRAAKIHGVDAWLNFRGYVDEAELGEALRDAHFALNLRWPSMGETSASQLRYWSVGLPTLVTNTGWYSELPDSVVCKVSVTDEVGSLLEILQDIVESPAEYQEMGSAGWQYLVDNHSPDIYARALVEFSRQRSETRLAYRMLDVELVETIASMCDQESALELFRQPVDIAVDLYRQPHTPQHKT